MNRDLVMEILIDLGLEGGHGKSPKPSGHNIQFCCPFHGETRPSAGIDVTELFGGCFGCGEGFTLAKLVAHCKEFYKPTLNGKSDMLDFVKAHNWLEDNYNITQAKLEDIDSSIFIDDYTDISEDNTESRFELDEIYLAPMKCGKVTHAYYYSRGFNAEDLKKFKVGWDANLRRIVFPSYYKDGVLGGLVGRTVYSEKSEKGRKYYVGMNSPRYFIYYNTPIKEVLYPLWLFKPKQLKGGRKRAILVEGFLDAQWMHKHGYHDTLSTVVSKMSYDKTTHSSIQVETLLKMGITDVILFKDNDDAGVKGAFRDFHLLSDAGIRVYNVTYGRGYGNDPQSLTKAQITRMIVHAKPYTKVKIEKLK